MNQPESHEHPLDEFSLRILRVLETDSGRSDDVVPNLEAGPLPAFRGISLK